MESRLAGEASINTDTTFIFRLAGGQDTTAVVSSNEQPGTRGILIVVGGPQYRVGSHRQFVLLARSLAAEGVPVMRFDCHGMGDAAGPPCDFTRIDADIQAAIDTFLERAPSVREVVLWGLCDAATAALYYAWQDTRVTGLVLLNPWVRTEAGQARTYLRHYYVQRLLSAAFWRKLLGGGLNWSTSLGALRDQLRGARRQQDQPVAATNLRDLPLPQAMAEGLARFPGPVLVLLSGNDLTAAEFKDVAAASPRWRELMAQPRMTRIDLDDADHTFSRGVWRDAVAANTATWVAAL